MPRPGGTGRRARPRSAWANARAGPSPAAATTTTGNQPSTSGGSFQLRAPRRQLRQATPRGTGGNGARRRPSGREGRHAMEFPIESQEQLDEAIKDRLARERRKVREQYAGQLAAG